MLIVFLRELEFYLDSTTGRSTSRLSKKLASVGMADTLRVLERAAVTRGEATEEEFGALLKAYTAMQRARDPHAAIGASVALDHPVVLCFFAAHPWCHTQRAGPP